MRSCKAELYPDSVPINNDNREPLAGPYSAEIFVWDSRAMKTA